MELRSSHGQRNAHLFDGNGHALSEALDESRVTPRFASWS